LPIADNGNQVADRRDVGVAHVRHQLGRRTRSGQLSAISDEG
jgi:hypothetical protein